MRYVADDSINPKDYGYCLCNVNSTIDTIILCIYFHYFTLQVKSHFGKTSLVAEPCLGSTVSQTISFQQHQVIPTTTLGNAWLGQTQQLPSAKTSVCSSFSHKQPNRNQVAEKELTESKTPPSNGPQTIPPGLSTHLLKAREPTS